MNVKSIAKPKRAKKMNPVVKGLLAVALVYIAGNMIVTCVKLQVQIKEKKAELEATNQEISAISLNKEELNDILDGKVDMEYIEEIAREKGFGSVGEKIYDNVTDD